MRCQELFARLARLLERDSDLWLDRDDGLYVVIDQAETVIGRAERLCCAFDQAEKHFGLSPLSGGKA